MSEPLTSHEIEDVLSSIRRLVSEDLRPAARQAAASASMRPAEAEASKLMLTPALRVVPDARPEPEPEAAALQDSMAVAEPAPDLSRTEAVDDALESSAVEVSLPDAGPAFAPAEEVYDDVGLDDGVSGLQALFDTPSAGVAPIEDAEADELNWSAAGEPEFLAEAEGDGDLALPPSEDSAGTAAPLHAAHGHWTAQDVPGVDWVEEETDWAEPDPVPFIAHPRKSDVPSDPLARAWADRAEAEVRAELEARLANSRAQAAAAAARDRPDMAQDAAPRAELFEGDGAEIDEEALRDIVRDIIREELAGALGERITRNVRKLVRVEINRALTAREFE